jgi:hypothetical protein
LNERMPGRRRPRCWSDCDDGGLEEREAGLTRPAEATDAFRPERLLPSAARFDLKNFAVGAVVSSRLVGLLGYGTILFFQAITPGEEGVNIGGA